ncbi:DMT family transporter [Paucibacter sp. B2R-40]|uniref:DMT family transporter n=1 Tax=Paucibacter sp. B2R-40 TaxID=2893554 RepID=UPI0021E4212E|nr:DMT family transporter [Paucibacter sp. B2R-40]MCV2353018.1 DMT family transporter [Paucibacter sp. B2R-40]
MSLATAANPSPSSRHSLAVGLAIVIAWGLNFPLQKALLTAMQPEGFLFLRFALMPLLVTGLLVQRYGLRWPGVSRSDAWALARLGLLGQGLHLALSSYGIHFSTPFSSSVLLACGPVFTLLILRAYGVERLQRKQLLGIAVAAAGALLFMSDKLLAANWRAGGGDAVLLLAAAMFSYYTVAAKPLIERLGAVLVMCYASLAATLPVLIYAAPKARQVDWAAVAPLLWLGAVWAIVCIGFITWLAWGWVNAQRGVARTAPLIYLMPPIAGLAAWASTGEQFTAAKLLGAAITLSGVALAQFAPQLRAIPVDGLTRVD